MTSIPASQLVQVNPGVIGAGGSALDLSGAMLTTNTAVPIGTLMPFATAPDVGTFFGLTSPEYAMAQVYFLGPDNSTKKPGRLWFWQYNQAAVGAYTRGASLSGMTLAQLQALTPSTIALTVDGVAKTSSSVNLAAATSFSNAAALIQAAFTGVNCSYDAQRSAFVLSSTTTGTTSTITVASDSTMATGLKLTAATGAVTSQGAAAATPGPAMDALTVQSQNWAAFMTLFEPVTADKVAFSAWTNGKNNRYAYVGWDTDPNALVAGSSTTWAAQIILAKYSGSIPIWKSMDKAAFALSWAASLNFSQTNGRATLAFKHQSGLTPDVTNATDATTLQANGYNFYGAYATANATFNGMQPGSVTGQFQWADTYLNEIWLNNGLQLAVMNLLFAVNSIPYNTDGYTMLESACLDPVKAALNFGAIRAGVTLSDSQKAQVNNAAGVPIDTVLSTRGWYIQIKDAAPIVRQARQSPPFNFWYMDGGSVQQINMSSIVLQ